MNSYNPAASREGDIMAGTTSDQIIERWERALQMESVTEMRVELVELRQRARDLSAQDDEQRELKRLVVDELDYAINAIDSGLVRT